MWVPTDVRRTGHRRGGCSLSMGPEALRELQVLSD